MTNSNRPDSSHGSTISHWRRGRRKDRGDAGYSDQRQGRLLAQTAPACQHFVLLPRWCIATGARAAWSWLYEATRCPDAKAPVIDEFFRCTWQGHLQPTAGAGEMIKIVDAGPAVRQRAERDMPGRTGMSSQALGLSSHQ